MVKKEYSWEVGGNFASFAKNMDANKVGKELEKLGEDITASGVVAIARKKSSEMHDFFEWDDSKAGPKYREIQARQLINMLKVTYTKGDKETPPVKAYVNVKRCSGYSQIDKAVNDVNRYQMLLNRAYEDLRIVRNRYTELEEIQERLAFLDNV